MFLQIDYCVYLFAPTMDGWMDGSLMINNPGIISPSPLSPPPLPPPLLPPSSTTTKYPKIPRLRLNTTSKEEKQG